MSIDLQTQTPLKVQIGGSAPSLSQPPPAAAQPEQRRRAKNLLKNYYGLDSPADPSAPPVKRRLDPLDVDSPGFEIDKYFQKLLHEKSLTGLLQKDTDLITEIRQLDGDMKTLVYENYSKFISATDTIRRMKSNVENMETEMERLTKNVERITQNSAAINEAFGDRRSRIHQLSGVHNLLKKVQFIFELPTRLTECLKQRMHGQAVRYYARASKLLEHYRHLSVFRAIEDECRSIMQNVGKDVKNRMRREEASTAEVTECIGMLIGLGEDPIPEIWKEYIKLATYQINKTRSRILDHIPQLPVYTKEPTPPTNEAEISKTVSSEEKDDAVTYLNKTLLTEISDFLTCFRSYFLNGGSPTLGAGMPSMPNPASPTSLGAIVGTKLAAGDMLLPNSGVDRAFIAMLDPKDKDQARKDLMEAIETLTKDYLDIVESFLQFPADPLTIDISIPAHVFVKVQMDSSASDALHTEARLEDRLRRCARTWVRSLMQNVFGSVRVRLFERMAIFGKDAAKPQGSQIGSSPRPDIAQFLSETEQWFQSELVGRCLPVLEAFAQPEYAVLRWPNGVEEYLSYVQTGLRDFWDSVLQSMLDYVQPRRLPVEKTDVQPPFPPLPPPSCPPTPVVSLIFACLARFSSHQTAPICYELFSDRLFGTGKKKGGKERLTGMGQYAVYGNAPTGTESGNGGGVEQHFRTKEKRDEEMGGLFPEGREVATACKEQSQRLLNRFVELIGQEISIMIRRSHETRNWLALREPRKVSKVWEQVLADLNEIESDAVLACGNNEDTRGNDQSSEGSRRKGSYMGGSSHHSSVIGSSSRNRHYTPSQGTGGGNSHRSVYGNSSVTGGSSGGYDRNLLSRIDKLFSERVEIFGLVPFGKEGILTGVVKIMIKTFIEVVRLRTFSRNGFQQIQVDVEHLRVHLWKFLNDDRLLNSMLEEVVTSAHRRCTDPVPMEQSVIEKVIGTYEGRGEI